MPGSVSVSSDSLQWGRRRTSTETLATAREPHACGGQASMGPTTNVDGDEEVCDAANHELVASMGPPTNVDGDKLAGRSTRGAMESFNGAADERRRRPGGSPRAGRRARCFNGAADERRRRRVRGQGVRCAERRLQWGRRRTSTETRLWGDYASLGWYASMGPPTNVDGDQGDC